MNRTPSPTDHDAINAAAEREAEALDRLAALNDDASEPPTAPRRRSPARRKVKSKARRSKSSKPPARRSARASRTAVLRLEQPAEPVYHPGVMADATTDDRDAERLIAELSVTFRRRSC